MYFGMILLNKGTKTALNYATWILTPFLFILNMNMFTKALVMMLKNGLAHLTMMKMMQDPFQQVRTRKKMFILKMSQVERLRKYLLDKKQKHGHT